MIEWVVLPLIGFLAGGYGVIVGAGGGFIIAPFLLLLLHLPPAIAAGTSLTAVFLNTLAGTLSYTRQQRIDYRVGLMIALPAVPGAFVGAAATQLVAPSAFRALFGLLLLGLAVYVAIRPEPARAGDTGPRAAGCPGQAPSDGAQDAARRDRRRAAEMVAAGFGLGFISSFFGVGAGWLVVPLLVHVYRFPTHTATATSIFSLSVYSAAGVAAHALQGNVLWPAAWAAGLGAVIAAPVCVHLSTSLKGTLLIRLLALALAAVGVTLLVR